MCVCVLMLLQDRGRREKWLQRLQDCQKESQEDETDIWTQISQYPSTLSGTIEKFIFFHRGFVWSKDKKCLLKNNYTENKYYLSMSKSGRTEGGSEGEEEAGEMDSDIEKEASELYEWTQNLSFEDVQ